MMGEFFEILYGTVGVVKNAGWLQSINYSNADVRHYLY